MINQVYKLSILSFVLFLSAFVFNNKTDAGKPLSAETINNSYNQQMERFFISSWGNNNQNFNGIITQEKTTMFDTVKSIFYVCDSIVRIENFDKNQKLKDVYIYYLNKNEYYIINDKLKKYKFAKIPKINYSRKNIIKTRTSKYINDKKCFLWKIKQDNKIFSYWVTGREYNFFYKICNLYYRRNKTISSFASTDIKGIMPMISEERTKLRKIISRIEITNIEPATIDKSVFEIPKSYKLIN